MFGDSEETSERTPSVHISSDEDLSSHSRLEYLSDNSSVSDKESTSDPSLGKASPSGRRPKEVILPNVFLVDMSDEPTHASKKRQHTFDVQSSSKGVSGSSIRLEACEVVADAPRHGKGKSLMTSQGPAVSPPLPLLVKDKGYAVDTTHSII
nr:hypothetical protein CFP56_09752 [Quercus suber]